MGVYNVSFGMTFVSPLQVALVYVFVDKGISVHFEDREAFEVLEGGHVPDVLQLVVGQVENLDSFRGHVVCECHDVI